jgi:hypothetical protein
VVIQGSVREEGSFTIDETKSTFDDPDVIASLQNHIRKYMEGQGSADVTKVYVHGDIYLVSTNSKYCENLKRNHASNHVWFLISGDSIRQKCFCRCETIRGRINGFCKDFSGRALVLPDDVYKAMYPKGKPMFVVSAVKPSSPPPTESPVDMVNAYINKHITPCEVKSLTKKKNIYTVHTSLICGDCEKTEVPFTICLNKKERYIQQKCGCKTRKFNPTDKIIDIL